MKALRNTVLLLTILLPLTTAFTQNKDLGLANEFYSAEDYQKAVDIYQKYIYRPDYYGQVYEPFVHSKIKLRQDEDLSKVLKKLLKQNQKALVRVDLLVAYCRMSDLKAADKQYKNILDKTKDDNLALTEVMAAFELRQDYQDYEQLLLDLRSYYKDDQLYAEELINLYRITGQKKRYIEESLLTLSWLPELKERLQNQFQISFSDKDYDILEQSLFVYIGKTNATVYQQMLVWLYLQRKDFYEAFVQQRSIDLKLRQGGAVLLEISNIAAKNKSYEEAEEILTYVCDKYTEQPIYVIAKRRLIEIQEIAVNNSFPVDTVKVNSILSQYDVLKQKARSASERSKIQFSQAKLYAFQLNDFNKSIDLLTAIAQKAPSRQLRAESSLLLGDIFLFQDDTGEASLQYFKVEKGWPNSTYAEDAKFKNAKLYYYTGEIDLAESMLDILKRATSREICNDAIDLSVFIKSNSGLDTSYQAIQMYARAELLTYQHKYKLALTTYDSLVKGFQGHDLTVDVLWNQSEVFKILQNSEARIALLKKIESDYKSSILADDAVYQLALYYEQQGQKSLAMDYYKKILIDFKGSIYLYQARKSYRKLRGDKI